MTNGRLACLRSLRLKETYSNALLRCLFFLLCPLLWTSNGRALDHSWQPNNPNGPYNLTDLDHFAVGDYGYCKWGNLMDQNTRGILSFTQLTAPWLDNSNNDLFLNGGLSALNILAYPGNWSWFAAGRVDITSPTLPPLVHNYSLFRKLHFNNWLKDETTNRNLSVDASKVIVVIHGWNRLSKTNPFSGEFEDLRAALLQRLKTTEWKLVLYNWNADADTGNFMFDPTAGIDPTNPTKAAEIAHQHGQHLGELLKNTAALQKVHFVAHSAGTWAARSAAKYLLHNTSVKIQITLLDPFVPGEMRSLRVIPNDTALQASVIDALPSLDPTNSGQLFFLENYYALDDFNPVSVVEYQNCSDYPDHATSQVFAWGTRGINLRVDSPSSLLSDHYRWHSGPVKFFSDTITYPHVSDLAALQPFNVNQVGWRRSMFYQEPQITPLPNFTKSYKAGDSVPLKASVKIRGDPGLALYAGDYRWEKKPAGGVWASVASGSVPASTTPFYAVPDYVVPVAAGMDGTLYRLVFTNNAGTDVSNEVRLDVAPSSSPVLAAPSGLVARATGATQVSLSWTNNTTAATRIVIERKTGENGTYAPLTTTPAALPPTNTAYFDGTVVPQTTYYYRVIAAGATTSVPSPEAHDTTFAIASAAHVLMINSSTPASGVRVYVGPNDISGVADGHTPFARRFTNGTDVTLVALATWEGAAFVKWRKNGQDWSASPVTTVRMDGSHTLTMVYASPPPVSTSYSVSVSASPSSGGTVTGGGTYAVNASVTIGATAIPGHTFLNWTRNASAADGGITFAVQPQVTFPATANLSLVANFMQDVGSYWNVSTSSEPAAGGSTGGGGVYAASSNIPLTAQPNPGYVFDYWTADGVIISYIQNFSYPQISRSHQFVAHFRIPAPGSAPDLFPTMTLTQPVVFSGGTGGVTSAVRNRGTLSSNPFWVDFRISESNTTVPSAFNLDFYFPAYVGANLPAGLDAGLSGGFSVPGNLIPGSYYLWMVVDPETASGEPVANRGNNIIWQPLTVLPAPPVSGVDLVPREFTVTPAAALPGEAIAVSGSIRNIGTAPSAVSKFYVSISTSSTVPPDKNALGLSGNVPVLGVYADASSPGSVSVPGSLPPGNHYLWIMSDPENSAGEPAGNRLNNNMVLPFSVRQPETTHTIICNVFPAHAGSVTGGGTYVDGALVPVVAVPSPGYVLSSWTDEGVPASASGSYTFIATGSRTLSANFQTVADNWRQTWFGTTNNAGDAADTFDYDADGLPNLIEFAFGLNPTRGSSSQLPQGGLVGGNYVISFDQPLGGSGIAYGAEWSPDLVQWFPITDMAGDGAHYFSVPVSGHPRLFVRLKVTRQ